MQTNGGVGGINKFGHVSRDESGSLYRRGGGWWLEISPTTAEDGYPVLRGLELHAVPAELHRIGLA